MNALTEKEKHDAVRQWVTCQDPDHFFTLSENLASETNLLESNADQGHLRVGLPDHSFLQPAISKRIFWFPKGIPDGTSVLLASSRIGNRPDTKPFIFDALRTICCRFETEKKFLISHKGTAPHEFVKRAADLFAIPFLEFRPFPKNVDSSWFESELTKESNFIAYYDAQDQPQADELLINIAHQVYLLSVRANGNIAKATTKRQAIASNAMTWFLANQEATSRKLAESLTADGVIPWYLYKVDKNKQMSITLKTFITLEEFQQDENTEDYLVHWTRRRNGPWPNETMNQFADNLILGLDSSDHSKFATLFRIVASGKIFAGNTITRDSTPVVSFTGNNVVDFPKLRKFRPHLSRWDFETVGIAIKRDALERQGVRKVIYGSDQTWDRLSISDRPLFQSSGSSMDWTNEREWRLIGDLNLHRIKTNEAFLYVDCPNYAARLASLSNWPVVLIGGSPQKP